MASRRYFDNECLGREQLETVLSLQGGSVSIKDHVKIKLNKSLTEMLQDVDRGTRESDGHDISVYTGVTGYALLYLHLYEAFKDTSYLDSASSYASFALNKLKFKRITFLCGDAGPLAVGAVAFHMHGKAAQSKDCIDKLISMVPSILPMSSETYDELLYGRAGYLYSLLFVRMHLGESSIPEKVLNDVVDAMVESGKNKACGRTSKPQLVYNWHGSEYIGAAHGYIGILYLMLHTNYERHTDCIKSTLQFIMNLQYPSGNFPSSYGSDKDKLIHWCHGSPGGVYLMIKAFSEFKEEKYLVSAQNAADSIWERGLLQKGYGLCHGVSGNGYGLLAMYKLTNDPKYLFRAVQFGLWCCEYKQRQGVRTPDRPFSMFEGIAGTAYFLSDLLQHEKAKFPAFEI